MRLLVAEDDARTADYLVRGLAESGHVVDRTSDGDTALAMALEGLYDVIVLDRLMPGLDGVTLVRRLRASDPRTPVLMLSAISGTADRIEGIRAGCDDYLVKPFAFVELLARLDALARRADRSRHLTVLQIDDLELDVTARTVTRAGRAIALQRREFILLELLMRHMNQVVTRTMLLEAAWDYDFEARGNVVDMHIHRLRQKIDEGFARPLIRTVPGAGYRIQAGDEPSSGEDSPASD
ncbi:response regulator transcription factor (plasmid) [Azospirillum sp. TSA2s]|uniref:response regulator transcription factor n=1 Tax=Azospirillum sp. TSA2s TaxID=709810 RepID=UPI0010AB4302|nr:response regulator transcription factor [Azospirillum sp. TSA2s]QCG99345.1 response regulator transcription factor [Azospirillum sp. TSA2s]